MGLDKIKVTSLNRIKAAGGDVLHGMKKADIGYVDFGEAYFSTITYGSIKAWKRHREMTLNLIVPVGAVRFVFIALDNRNNILRTRTEEVGAECYSRVTVPPGIWFGFQGISKSNSLILNIADIPHNPSEVDRMQICDTSLFRAIP